MSGISSPKAHKKIGVAVISNPKGKILIDRRKSDGEMGGLWEFPGGKIEPGETVEECIEREIKEELDIEITVSDRLTTITHDYQTFTVTLYVHLCQYIRGKPQPIECEEIQWVDPFLMNQYQFPQANAKIINLLQQRGIKQ
ncbi:8-oxo-dGTP diphosphatase MutT [Waterburya agarophytonicola K14]|uniref:8-oxo-dGTP diphosphatase n=1 Tax=Waterburya agarophytonicola KI4 TaxID=2874699 RepID=A0A964BQ78_9CYAN|nr:8-oxo-dGTP diphosphatase MutT [Waterburya agarophytonicola]MCC0177574.1 8-oxo-dGTP diphosphatase MutT [Waterburya agarophytonicola KI4]